MSLSSTVSSVVDSGSILHYVWLFAHATQKTIYYVTHREKSLHYFESIFKVKFLKKSDFYKLFHKKQVLLSAICVFHIMLNFRKEVLITTNPTVKND